MSSSETAAAADAAAAGVSCGALCIVAVVDGRGSPTASLFFFCDIRLLAGLCIACPEQDDVAGLALVVNAT